jgi:hypothetical protein
MCDAKTLAIVRRLELCSILGRLPSEVDNERNIDLELMVEYKKAMEKVKKNG